MRNQPDPAPEIDAEIMAILEALKKGGWDYSIKGNEIRIYAPEWLKDVHGHATASRTNKGIITSASAVLCRYVGARFDRFRIWAKRRGG